MRIFENQKEIYDRIIAEFVHNRELVTSEEVTRKMNLLVENKLATTLSGVYEDGYDIFSPYLLACKMVCENDKDMLKFVERKEDSSFTPTKKADMSREITKLYKYDLQVGTYLINFGEGDDEDYMALVITSERSWNKKFHIYFVGDKAYKRLVKFLKESAKYEKLSHSEGEDKIRYTDGKPSKNTVFKSFDKMVFSDKDKMLKYIDSWKENIPTLYKYGISPKLSILLYGEPGTGKSTFAKAVAKHLGITNVVNVGLDYFTSDRPTRIPSYEPSVMSLDDIDCICDSREDDHHSSGNNQVLYKLLEFLDNPPTYYFQANDGMYYPISIVIASTNYIDKLDKAVKRHGRFDAHIEMKYLTKDQAKELCALYELKLSDVYTDKIDDDFTISPAYLQALCIENVEKSLKNISKGEIKNGKKEKQKEKRKQ